LTLVQMQNRPAGAHPVPSTAGEAMDAVGPQVWHDMTVEVALSVTAAARTGHLVLCDADGQYVGLVTRARLAAVRDSRGYTDRMRLSDITEGSATFAEHGSAPGFPVPALSR
jgi:hypothetical protein